MYAITAALVVAGCGGPRSVLDPAGPAARGIAQIWWVMFGGAVVVWVLVVAFLLIALLRGHNTRALARPQRLIVGGLVLPTLLLGSLLVWGTLDSARLTGVGEQPEAVIEVTGRQWAWEFRYLDDTGTAVAASRGTLAMPLGRLVEFRITSADVIHSFWIPRLGGKMDAIPGRVNRLRLRADHDGRGTPIRGQCAEFCGLSHAHMHFDVVVLAEDEWATWLDEHAIHAQAGTGVSRASSALLPPLTTSGSVSRASSALRRPQPTSGRAELARLNPVPRHNNGATPPRSAPEPAGAAP